MNSRTTPIVFASGTSPGMACGAPAGGASQGLGVTLCHESCFEVSAVAVMSGHQMELFSSDTCFGAIELSHQN